MKKEYMTWQDEYKSKLVSAEDAAKRIKSGDVVGFGMCLTAPTARLVDPLLDRANELENVRIVDIVPIRPLRCYNAEFMSKNKGSFLYTPCLYGVLNRELAKTRNVDYWSIQSSDCGDIYQRRVTVAMVMVCTPEAGMVNLGLSNFNNPEMIRGADLVIAEVNDQMPMVYGDNWLPISDFDLFVENSTPIPEFKRKGEPTDIENAIAENVASMIRDGDCIQMGIGTLPEAIVRLLRNKGKKDLGVHTEMFPMGLPDLVREGIVTNKCKSLHTGKSVASFCAGDHDMYEYTTRNPDSIFHPTSYTNAPYILRQIDNLVAINMDAEVDFMGQLNAERVEDRWIGACGGQLDFTIGARWSRGGRAINLLSSTRKLKSGKVVSTIVPAMPTSSCITVPHIYTQYVVTEYGIADLFYKTIRERAEALIAIAHPDFRADLRKEAKRMFY